eukprot:scaffold534179_cov45-Prasinocladus_malaysianus.AAC.1
MARVAEWLAGGRVQALAGVMHPMRNVQAALRQMSQARHIGKVVASCISAPAVRSQRGSRNCIPVTGGMGMLGRLIGGWLLQFETAHVVLLGRSAGKDLRELAMSNGLVTALNCDVGMEEDLGVLTCSGGTSVGGL